MENTFNKLYKNLGLNFYTTSKKLKSTLLVLLLVFAFFSIKAQTVTIQNATASGCYYYSGASKTTITVQVGWTGANNGNIITVTLDGTSTRTIKPQSNYDPGSGSAVAGPIVTPQVIAFEINADGNSHSLVAVLSNGASATSGTVNVLAPSACVPMACTGTNLGGMTYYDNNANGIHDGGEIKGIPNVTVTATDKNGTTYTAISNSEGKYAFSAANSNAISAINYPVRVEFSNWPGLVQGYAGPSLSGNKSNVRFLNAAACNVDCGGVNPLSYSQSVPPVFTNLYTNGNPLAGGSAGTSKAIIQHAYNSYTDRSVTTIATSAQVGSVWAHAWNKYKSRLFSAAFVKRHVGLGPLGLGGIYTVDYSNPASPVVSNFINVAAIGINVGTIASNSSRGLGANKLDPNADAAAFAQVGKLGIGGMDLSDDGNTLYIMNLFDKKVYAIDITNYLASGTLPTALNVTSFLVPDPGCTGGSYRPFALKVYENKLYAGIVCDASTGSKSNLTASIKGLDLATNVWSDVFNFPLTYPKGYPSAGKPEITGWYPWTDNISVPFQNNDFILWPTPVLTDIEFDLDGAMTIALMDRIGHQMGNYNWDNAAYNDGAQTDAGGDVLRAFYSNGAYVLENNAKAGPTTGYAPNNNQGPGFGEFYHDDFDAVGGYHTEMATGGLTVKPGSGEIMIGMVDPSKFRGGDIWANGVRINSSLTGDPIEGKSYYSDAGIASFGKANGMGDIEIASDNISFLEVGNYAWKDLDTDGIQDPAETGVSGVVLRMYKASDGSQVATSTTDANGNYYFSTLNGQTILPNTNYKILAGVGQFSITDTTILVNGVKYKITLTNIGQGANTTLNDNNFSATSLSTALGSIPAGIPFFNITTGNAGYVNHSIDLGLYALPGLGDTAWNDLNKNGLQDVGETPFQNLKVYLLNASGTKIDSTTTNSSGYYQFINLQPSVYYQVQFTSPGSTFTSTLQNVGADDNDDSDIDALLKTQQVTLTWNEFNKTLDAGFYACTKPNAGSNLTACGGTCVNITGTTPTSGLWAAMVTNPTGATLGSTTSGVANVCFTNASTGTYNFIYFTGGCSDTMNIVVAAKPNAGTDKSVCINTTATMNATGSGSWTAQVGNPASAIITSTSSATSTITGLSVIGTYNFIWTVGSCTDTVSIVVNELPTVSAGSPFTKTCVANTSGATIGEANESGNTYSWSPALGLSSTTVSNPTANPSSTTTYTVTKTNTTTGCTATASVLVTVNNVAITVSAGSPFTKTCTANTSGATIGEANESGNSYSWSPTLGLSSTSVSNPTANPSSTTTYTVTKTNTTTGCTATASVLVTVNNGGISVSTGSPFTKTCIANTSGATIGEANESGNTYSWSPALGLSSTSVSNPTSNPSSTTTYTVTKTNTTTGCTATASVLVTVNNAAITVSAGSPFTKTCTANTSGASIGEANDVTATYSWSPALGLSSTTVSNPTANPSSTTTYTVTKTNTTTGCTATASVLVTVNTTLPIVSAGSSVCVGSNMNLTLNTGGIWASSNNSVASVTNSGLVTGNNAGNVNFTFTNSSNGCSATTTNVAINANTSSTTTANICLTDMPYVWNSNTYNTAGTYLVHLTNSKGCDSAATLVLNVINASVGNYVWSDLNNNGIQDEPTSAGLNGVIVDLYKETTPGNFTIVGTTTTTNNGSGNPGYYNFTICSDGNYKVKFPTSNGGNGLTNQTTTAGTDGNNDADIVSGFSPAFTINTNGSGVAKNNPTIDAGYVVCTKPNAGSDITTCPNVSILLVGTSPNSGSWSAMTGNPIGATVGTTILGESEVSFSSLASGNYYFIYTVSGGCSDTVKVFAGNPTAAFTYTINCKNEVTFVNTSVNATDYEWIIGDRTICTTSSINAQTLHSDVEGGTSYMVTLIAKNNSLCYDTMTQMITIYPPAITVFSANPIGCTTKVKFNNFTLFGSNYTWDFGVVGLTTDRSTQLNPTYTYPSNGTYNVSLISSNTEGCGDTLTLPVVVNSNGIAPTANFTISDISNACANRYHFTNTSTNAVSYQWIFVDGSIVNTVNASKSFATAGTYAVTLVAQSSTGCFDTLVQNVNVLTNSTGTVASFGVNNRSQCLANNSFEFYNTSVFMGSGWIPTYNWDFGDGTFDNTNSSVFNKHYATPGIYTIRVIAIGTNGCRDTAYQSIEVLPSPIAAFTANTYCGMTAYINNQTTGAIANIWHFGTGYYVENNNAAFSNRYYHENWYNISLIAIGANGCKDVTDRGVFPTRVNAPVPNFYYDTLACSRAIRFHNSSIGGASASWNFGDGSPLSTDFDPTHVYTVGGTYTVTLTLSNGPFCSAVYTSLVYAPQGYNLATPKAGLTYQIAACSNTITASDTSLNSGSRSWYFDGVLISTSASLIIPNPTVGGHELKLIVSNGVCFDTLRQFVLIQAAPISVASHQISSCSRTAVFSSQATSGNTYNWKFNDAGEIVDSAIGSLVSHTFSANGTYYVTLTSTNLTGCSTSTIDTVVVNAGSNPLNAAFKFNNATCNCVCNNKILFTNLSTGAGNTYLWNFGDGTSTTQANPNKGFAEAGTYNVTLTAVSPTGCISVASMQVTILPTAKGPSASFNTDNQVQCLTGNNFSFYNTSKHMGAGWNMKYYWDFGDGTTDSVNTFVFNKHYTVIGTYTVMLVALGSDNCYDTMTMTVQVKNTNCLIYSNKVQVFSDANHVTPLFAANNNNTGITENVMKGNAWTLYPNPNTGTFNIACNKLSSNVIVEVIDILGRKVNANISKNYTENKVEISCTNINTGNYFVIITNGKDGESTRLKFNITQ
jgi:PKD repeat protein